MLDTNYVIGRCQMLVNNLDVLATTFSSIPILASSTKIRKMCYKHTKTSSVWYCDNTIVTNIGNTTSIILKSRKRNVMLGLTFGI